jgi:hypothetical protein
MVHFCYCSSSSLMTSLVSGGTSLKQAVHIGSYCTDIPFLASISPMENLFHQIMKVHLVLLLFSLPGQLSCVRPSQTPNFRIRCISSICHLLCWPMIPKAWGHIRISEDPSPSWLLLQNCPMSLLLNRKPPAISPFSWLNSSSACLGHPSYALAGNWREYLLLPQTVLVCH